MASSNQAGGVVNIAGYRFVDMPDRDELRQPFRDICQRLGLAGTVLLSHEGINFVLSGSQDSIDSYLAYLAEDERFSGISLKVSYSDRQPFRRMLVRLKKEIISIGMPEIVPAEFTGPEIEPAEFKAKLDAGEEVVLLDTRNDYELRVGTFANAVDLNITSFRDFPNAINNLPKEMKDKEIVMFCTGGIRCEKASAVMLNAGFQNVKQLKGGILGYFEECGGAHWNGDCFVFDRRVALNPQLEETCHEMCFACREPLGESELQSEKYVLGESCPYCA
ncbi:MAG: rhodanese-like domain-containing protein [Candidatus Poseidoniaceae archaeon]|jgi:predicted sulfurtransferase|nr:rhodanese-like domain-containing protein [Candidatus Poseidoniaceae archaeon]